MDPLNISDFVCPSCRAPLKRESEALVCVSCHARFPVQDGVPDFRLVRDRYWGEYPPETMDRLLDECRRKGWRDGLRDFFKTLNPGYYEYLTDEKRSHWSYLFSLSKEAKVLDAGCGWGLLSFSLVKHFGNVYGLDIVRQRSAFVRMRAEQDHVSRVIPVSGQATHLPFGDDFFDLVVLNGVLEWIPSTEDGDPQKVQEAALREVYRVLKPGGTLYLAIENRWAAINFLGFRDTHSGLRFAPILPRGLAQIYSRLARKKDFREYTYTYGEHRRLLKKAGFASACFCAPLPSYRRFYFILPIEDTRRVRFFIKKLVSSRNFLQRFFVMITDRLRLYGLVRYFVPDFSILAKKEGGQASEEEAYHGILHQGDERVTQFIFKEEELQPRFVHKIYERAQASERQIMCDLMGRVYAHADPCLAGSVPRIYSCQCRDSYFVVQEEFVAGVSLRLAAEQPSFRWKRHFLDNLMLATDWLSAFHAAFPAGRCVFAKEHVAVLLEEVEAYCRCGLARVEKNATAVPGVVRHGDFRPANVIRFGNSLKVIDWDRYALQGVPLLDLMEFIIRYVHAHLIKQSSAINLTPAVFLAYLKLIYLRDSALSRGVRLAINRYAQALSLDAQQTDILLTYWAHRMFYPRDKRIFVSFEKA